MAAVLTGGSGPDTPGGEPVVRRVAPDDAPVVVPSREDGVVRGLSEIVGGPLGDHAAAGRGDRWLTPARIVFALAVVVLFLHWLQKAPCQDGAWADNEQYTKFCYSDVVALYFAERLNEGAVPYLDHPVEYPVLTGYLMGAIGLPVHAIGEDRPGLNQVQAFYNLTALVLLAFGLAAVAVTLALRRYRPWDGLLFVLAPALLLSATVNWDLFAVGLTALFLYAWARHRPVLAGVLLGLATAAKFYPLFLIGPLIVLALRTGRWRAAATTIGTAAATWAVVNAPPFFGAREGWARFFVMSSDRPVDWGTFWYIGKEWPIAIRSDCPSGQTCLGLQPFVELSEKVTLLNWISYVLFGLGCVGIAALAFLAPRRPRLAQLCFLVVAVFLLTSKVWSQQFVLWLIPLAVLARPRWGAFLAWQAAEVAYFLGFYAHLLNLSGANVMPESIYVYISAARWWTLLVLVAFVVRDIVAPRHDLVWATYDEDPDGGDFAGAPDLPWIMRARAWADEKFDPLRTRVRGAGRPHSRVKTTASG
jgi:uncharacterized membrane protein